MTRVLLLLRGSLSTWAHPAAWSGTQLSSEPAAAYCMHYGILWDPRSALLASIVSQSQQAHLGSQSLEHPSI